MTTKQSTTRKQTRSRHRFKDLDACKNPKGGGGGKSQVQSGTAASKGTIVDGILIGDGG